MSPVYIFHYKKLKKLFFSTTASAKSYSGSSQGANGINGSLRPIMPDWGLTDSAIRLSWAKHYATKRRRIKDSIKKFLMEEKYLYENQ
jgi:hypothetical protein